MRLKIFCALALAVCALAGCARAVDVSAKSAILYEPSSGQILYQKDINTQREIASTTKIMTALLAIENLDQDEVVTVKAEHTGIEGTSMYLQPDEKYTVKTLLHGLMLQSGNDAALVLAGQTAGSQAEFVRMMNLKAQSLGMTNTCFKNPNGLPEDGHYSTAYDMAKLAGYAMEHPEFREIVSSKTYTAEGKTFVNHNKLLKMSRDIDGVKTGFTKAAGRCLVSSAVKDGMRLVAVTLSAPNDWDDHLNLYEFGFDKYAKETFIDAGQVISRVHVIGGLSDSVSAAAVGDLSAVLPKEQLGQAHVEIYLPRFIYAPVTAEKVIGEARLIHEDKVISKTAIISLDSCLFEEKKTLLDKLKEFFANFR